MQAQKISYTSHNFVLMNPNNVVLSVENTLENLINATTSSANTTIETGEVENLESDDSSDHFIALKRLSVVDFCKSIRNAENGEVIYNLVANNFVRGMGLLLYS